MLKIKSTNFTEQEVCELLEISRSTLWRWRTKKGFPFERDKLTGKITCNSDAIIKWHERKLHELMNRLKNTPNLGQFNG